MADDLHNLRLVLNIALVMLMLSVKKSFSAVVVSSLFQVQGSPDVAITPV